MTATTRDKNFHNMVLCEATGKYKDDFTKLKLQSRVRVKVKVKQRRSAKSQPPPQIATADNDF